MRFWRQLLAKTDYETEYEKELARLLHFGTDHDLAKLLAEMHATLETESEEKKP